MPRPMEAVPEPTNPIDLERYVLRRAAIDMARSECQMAEAVEMAREAGVNWDEISRVLGVSAEVARVRFGPLAESA